MPVSHFKPVSEIRIYSSLSSVADTVISELSFLNIFIFTSLIFTWHASHRNVFMYSFFLKFKSSLIISFGGLLAAFFSHGSIEKDPPTMLCICDALCLKCLWLFYWNSPTIWGAKVQIDKILEYICDFWVCVCVQPQLGMIHMYVSLRTDVMLLI